MVRLCIACFYSLIPLLLTATWTTASSASSTGETVLLDFSSTSCEPCQQMRPTLQQLVGAGYPIREIDVMRDRRRAEHYGITQVPAFVLLVNGREFARMIGPASYRQLEQMFQTAGINPAAPQANRQATRQATRQAVPANQIASVEMTSGDRAPKTFASQPQAGRIVPIQQATPGPRNGPTPAAAGSVPDAKLLESTVRITVQDTQGNSTGTGTIVDTRSGAALVLTCGHLFRSSNGQGAITVTLFEAGSNEAQVRSTLAGRLIDYDLQRDLGLVSFQTSDPVQVTKVAPPGTKLTPNLPVATVGCNHGQNPTVVATHVTTVGRYQGPPNVEVAGAPVEGRSGGGLFNSQGQLVGVCFAADPQDSEGLYSAVDSIHAKLDSLGLTTIYQPAPVANQSTTAQSSTTKPKTIQPKTIQSSTIQPEVHAPSQPHEPSGSNAAELATTPTQQPFAVRGQQPATATPSFPTATTSPSFSSDPIPGQPVDQSSRPVASGPAVKTSLSRAEQATLEEIVRRGANSEIICIIRPKTPNGKSEVITLSNASANFVRALTAPNHPQTAARLPADRPR